MAYKPASYPGSLHHYTSKLVAFEFALPAPSTSALHTAVFVGGLFDGLLTVPYAIPLAAALPPRWRLIQPILSSSYIGWGTSSLDKDVDEIAQCINYIHRIRPQGKVILMGHSTGCQDTIHYLLSPEKTDDSSRPGLSGAIMQACVSDREAIAMFLSSEAYDASVKLAETYICEGRGADVLPMTVTSDILPAPISAIRWLSLASPSPNHTGEDDYFSSDFSDERLRSTFGKIGATKTPIQILYGEKDQYVPESVDKESLVKRWTTIIKEGGGVVDEDSGVLDGADHNLNGATADVLKDFISRVVRFVKRIDSSP